MSDQATLAVGAQLERQVMQRATHASAFPYRPERREPAGDNLFLVTPGDEPGMSLRDYFATHATDADVLAMRDSVPLCTKVVDDPGYGCKRVLHNALPDDWRQLARYLHADRMLAVRAA